MKIGDGVCSISDFRSSCSCLKVWKNIPESATWISTTIARTGSIRNTANMLSMGIFWLWQEKTIDMNLKYSVGVGWMQIKLLTSSNTFRRMDTFDEAERCDLWTNMENGNANLSPVRPKLMWERRTPRISQTLKMQQYNPINQRKNWETACRTGYATSI